MSNQQPQQPQTQLAQNVQQPPANQQQPPANQLQRPEQVGQQAQQVQQTQQALNVMPANKQSMISFNTTAPEQAPASYQSIIDQQNEQIAALIAQNQALNGQITKMVQNGAQFYQPQQPAQVGNMPQYQNAYGGVNNPAIVQPQPQNPMQQFNPPALSSNQDWSLEALGKEIGKPRKEV